MRQRTGTGDARQQGRARPDLGAHRRRDAAAMNAGRALLVERVRAALPAAPAQTVLLVGSGAQGWLRPADVALHRLHHLPRPHVRALDGLGRVALALCVDLLREGHEPVLARLRDLHAAAIIAVESGPGASAADEPMRALGFSLLGRDAECSTYGFDVASYKRTPDWLNNRFWANPERWNRHRW